MDYEKKLALAKEAYDSGSYDKETIEYIFPELKETEDEKIRKALLEYFAEECDTATINGVYCHKIYAWLEKQKPIEHFELKARHWYICHRPFCCRADHLTVKEGEKFMCEKDGVVKGFIIEDPEKYFKESNPPAPMEEDMTWLENQGEQKPKWSEEDSLMIFSIIDTLDWLKGKGATDMKIDWLKNLRKRMEEQQ